MLKKTHCIYCSIPNCHLHYPHAHCAYFGCMHVFRADNIHEPHYHCLIKTDCRRLDLHIHCRICDWVGEMEWMHQHCERCGHAHIWGETHSHDDIDDTKTN